MFEGKKTIVSMILLAVFQIIQGFGVVIPEGVIVGVNSLLALLVVWFMRVGMVKKKDLETILVAGTTELTVEPKTEEVSP